MNIISPTNPLINTLVFYIIIISLIFLIKTDKFFCQDTGKIKQFGYKDNLTILPLPLFSLLLAIFLYLFFTIIESIYNKLCSTS